MYEVGDKFIIEIGEEYIYSDSVENNEQKNAPAHLYRIKGFNTLVFDKNSLKKLTKYDDGVVAAFSDVEAKGYEKGLSDAWEFIREIYKLPLISREKIFGIGNDSLFKILDNLTLQEAVEKLKEWEEKQEIQVGDVVDYSNVLIIVTYMDKENGTFSGIDANGKSYIGRRLSDCKKTGKHIDLTEIFKGLEEENAD